MEVDSPGVPKLGVVTVGVELPEDPSSPTIQRVSEALINSAYSPIRTMVVLRPIIDYTLIKILRR